MTKILRAFVHKTLFLAGKNFPERLDTNEIRGMTLEYDEERKQLHVTYNGERARIMEASIFSMIDAPAAPVVTPNITVPAHEMPKIKQKISAQVSTPQDHVFVGVNGGKVRI